MNLDEHITDVITLINILNLDGIKPIPLLKKTFKAIKPGGSLIVAGPTSDESFNKVEALILKHLKEDGLLETFKKDFELLKQRNKTILNPHANYWSEEGMAELLLEQGFSKIRALDNGIYKGLLYLIVAEK